MFLTVTAGSQYSISAPNKEIVFANSVLMEKNCRYLPRRTLKSWKHPNKTGWRHPLHGTGVSQNLLEELNHKVSELEKIWENILSTSADKETEIQSDRTQPASSRATTEEWQRSVWLQITGVLLSEDWPDGEWPLAEVLRTDRHVLCVCYIPYQVEPCHAWTSPHGNCQISDQRKLQTALSIHRLPVSLKT